MAAVACGAGGAYPGAWSGVPLAACDPPDSCGCSGWSWPVAAAPASGRTASALLSDRSAPSLSHTVTQT